jgi:hypothetical protein
MPLYQLCVLRYNDCFWLAYQQASWPKQHVFSPIDHLRYNNDERLRGPANQSIKYLFGYIIVTARQLSSSAMGHVRPVWRQSIAFWDKRVLHCHGAG